MTKSPVATKANFIENNSKTIEDWIQAPDKNPYNGRKIKINGPVYKKLVKELNFDPLQADIKTPPRTRSRSPRTRSRSPRTRSRSPRTRSKSPRTRSKSPRTRSKSPKTKKTKEIVSLDKLRNIWKSQPNKNPYNGRKIKINGPVYKKLIKELGIIPIESKENEIQKPSLSSEDCEKWNLNKTINPKTNRKISPSGPTYKKIEKDCDELLNNNEFPECKPCSIKKSFSLEDCEKWNLNKTINPKTNRKISPGGPTYKKIEKDCEGIESNKNDEIPSVTLNNKVFIDSENEKSRLELFKDLAEKHGFKMINVPMDGNCMLSAVGSYFNLNSDQLRNYLINFVETCKIKDDFFKFDEEFIRNLKTKGKWCDEETIRLITIALKSRLNILDEFSKKIITIGGENDDHTNILNIGYLNDFHYVILIKNNESQPIYSLPHHINCEETKAKTTENIQSSNFIDENELKKLIENIEEIKSKPKISTFLETEGNLLQSLGLQKSMLKTISLHG